MNAGRLAAAARAFDRALERTDDRVLRARIAASAAYLATDQHGLQTGLATIERVLGILTCPQTRGECSCVSRR